MDDVHNIYLARTYAYVAAGKHGLVILDIEKPESHARRSSVRRRRLYQRRARRELGVTYVTEFAYLADGKNGMHVVQLTGP